MAPKLPQEELKALVLFWISSKVTLQTVLISRFMVIGPSKLFATLSRFDDLTSFDGKGVCGGVSRDAAIEVSTSLTRSRYKFSTAFQGWWFSAFSVFERPSPRAHITIADIRQPVYLIASTKRSKPLDDKKPLSVWSTACASHQRDQGFFWIGFCTLC